MVSHLVSHHHCAALQSSEHKSIFCFLFLIHGLIVWSVFYIARKLRRIARSWSPQKIDRSFYRSGSLLSSLSSMCQLSVVLIVVFLLLLWSLRWSAPLVLFGGCEGRPPASPPRLPRL